jgi:hypothetical protein
LTARVNLTVRIRTNTTAAVISSERSFTAQMARSFL